jgi:hypothetical protein
VIVADTGRGRLVRFTWADGSLGPGIEVKAPEIVYPVRVQLDPNGNILVLDGKKKRIARLDPAGVFGGWLEAKGTGAGTLPVGFKLDAAGNMYVLDLLARKVVVSDPTGNPIRQIELPAGDDTAFTDVTVDAARTVYVFEAVDAVLWSAGKDATTFTALNKGMKDVLAFGTYLLPLGGKILVVDHFGHGIAVLGQDGSYQGRQLSIGASEGLVHYPSQLCINGRGEAFLADRSNDRVQIFTTAK